MKVNKNNAGMSVIELIVVIALLAILVGAGFASYNVIKNADVTKSTKNFASYYNKLRTYTMSQAGDWSLVISRDSDDMYTAAIYQGSEQKGSALELGKHIELKYQDEKGGEVAISSALPLTITLKASTGGVNTIYSGSAKVYESGADTSSYGIFKAERNTHDSQIKIYYVTGKALRD